MHFDVEHSLFFERRQPLRLAALSLGVTLCVLIANAGANSTRVSLIGAGTGALMLLLGHSRGRRRIEPALAWMLGLVTVVVLGGAIFSANTALAVEAGSRVLCGVVWVLWLGTQIDWASLRGILLRLRVPETIVATLDHALLHGVLTKREWARRRDTARLRLGTWRLPMTAWAPLLGEGAMQAFFRLERVEENALLRSSSAGGTEVQGALELDSVDVERGGGTVLQQVELQLQQAESVLICGPSGAGKSSLLRLIAGIDAPARGTLTRLGIDIESDTKLSARLDGRVALLSQEPEHHFIASTVDEDIAWGLVRRGVDVSEAKRTSFEMAKALNIGHLWERPCHELSFGEQRRVALAGLLVLDPMLILLDEPTAGLDPVAADELITLVERHARENEASFIWATHDLHSLPPRVDRVILLQDGRVLFDGPTAEGLSQPWLIRAGLAVPKKEKAAC